MVLMCGGARSAERRPRDGRIKTNGIKRYHRNDGQC